MHSVLVVEDNAEIARLIALHLRDIHCEAEIVGNGREALDCYRPGEHDLVVLDLMLPELDGISVCRRLRERRDYVPILMLTARSSEMDRVLGLEIGADDYLTKPFSIPEFLARVRAILRRVEALGARDDVSPEDEHVTRGALEIDVGKRRVRVRGDELSLTAREFDLLLYFARHPGRVFTRPQLLDKVWGYGHDGYEHTVNTHINRLRGKIENDPGDPRLILTVWGVGYRFTDEAP